MIDELRVLGAIRRDEIARAFSAVPRHVFAPGESLTAAYAANSSVLSKCDERGVVLSTVSAAHIQAVMLDQARLRPGMRVLEIGSGGYNAALIAELVGVDGEVTTVDIDPEVIDRTRVCLDAAGYGRVNTVPADADGGVPEFAPYDTVLVTARAWDIPPAWTDQLAEGGRIVVPLRLRGLTRSVALDRVLNETGTRLVGDDVRLCSFVPIQGAGAHQERVIRLDGGRVELRFDGPQPVDTDRLDTALFGPRLERWSRVEFDRPDLLDLWLASTLPVPGILTAEQGPIDDGLVGPAAKLGVPTLVSADGLAYRKKRPTPGTDGFEVGVRAHGPDAAPLAEQYGELLQRWRFYHHDLHGTGPLLEVFPAATTDADLPPGCVIDKVHTRIVITWP